MSWLRSTSQSLAQRLSRSLDPRHDYEPQACYSSFCKHWTQAYDIIVRSQPQHLHDDVLGVVNHLEQLSTLLVLEAKALDLTSEVKVRERGGQQAACFEYLLSENVLDKLYEWASQSTGKYENAVRLEQLKLYSSLIGHYSSQVIAAEPFLRPLLKLLSSFRNELPPTNVETQLVTVLNQLCVSLMQNMKFIDLFFLTTHTRNGSQSEFIIVRLLLSSVHRDARAGSTARDALLLCAKMSALNQQLADYMLASNTCPVLATGLSGLYSLLPRVLSDKVQRLTPDDVNQVHKLTLFVDSLEFCNAVAQVAHPSIKKHLLDLLYQGFLVPVMGPALLQTRPGTLQSGSAEQVAAMAYFELIVRCSTERGLLKTVLEFLLHYEYDGVRVVDVLLARLDGDTQLSLVALSLMETLIDLNCEDVMLELMFKYLLNGHHVTAAHRTNVTDPDHLRDAAVSFLALSPNCCARSLEKTREYIENVTLNGRRVLELRGSDDVRRPVNGLSEGIAMDNLVHEVQFNYGNPNETLFGNYHAYLCDSRFEIVARSIACSNWSSKYDSVTQPKRETNNNTTSKETREIDIPQSSGKEQDSLISVCTSGYETLKTSDTSEKEPHSLTSLVEDIVTETESSTGHMETKPAAEIPLTSLVEDIVTGHIETKLAAEIPQNLTSLVDDIGTGQIKTKLAAEIPLTSLVEDIVTGQIEKKPAAIEIQSDSNKEHDSLTSIGESSGYDSFRFKMEDAEDEGYAEESFWKSLPKTDVVRSFDGEMPLVRSWRASAESIIGPLLSSLLKKAASLLECDVAQNARVTCVISKLVSFPTPLMTSLLLCPGHCVRPNVPSLFQIVSKLKDELDELTESVENIAELVDRARTYLIQREMALVRNRAPAHEHGNLPESPSHQQAEVVFRRGESMRRSISTSFSNMFGRRLSNSSPSNSPQSPAHYTSPQKRPHFTEESYWNQSITLRSILNAVILDEWIKELAALAEEHALRLTRGNYEDDSYIRSVAL